MCHETVIGYTCGHIYKDPSYQHIYNQIVWAKRCVPYPLSRGEKPGWGSCPNNSTVHDQWIVTFEKQCPTCLERDVQTHVYRTQYERNFRRSSNLKRRDMKIALREEQRRYEKNDFSAQERAFHDTHFRSLAEDEDPEIASWAQKRIDEAVDMCYKSIVPPRCRTLLCRLTRRKSRRRGKPARRTSLISSASGLTHSTPRPASSLFSSRFSTWNAAVAALLASEQKTRNRLVEQTWAADVGCGPDGEDPRDWLRRRASWFEITDLPTLTRVEDLMPESLKVAPDSKASIAPKGRPPPGIMSR